MPICRRLLALTLSKSRPKVSCWLRSLRLVPQLDILGPEGDAVAGAVDDDIERIAFVVAHHGMEGRHLEHHAADISVIDLAAEEAEEVCDARLHVRVIDALGGPAHPFGGLLRLGRRGQRQDETKGEQG